METRYRCTRKGEVSTTNDESFTIYCARRTLSITRLTLAHLSAYLESCSLNDSYSCFSDDMRSFADAVEIKP